MAIVAVGKLFKAAFDKWQADRAPRLAAALAYYTLFSIAPLLVIAIAIASLMFGREMAQSQVVASLQQFVGAEAAQAIQNMLEHTARPGSSIVATVLGVAMMLLGASNVFNQLKDALNTIWGIHQPPRRGMRAMLRDRLLSFLMVLGIGLLLVISLTISAVVAALIRFLSHWLPGGPWVWQMADLLVSFTVITVLFAMIYKLLPDVELAWSDVWIGAAVTAVLFTLGKYLIGVYLGRVGVASLYGAAGSLVVLLLWVYYSAQIILFGAAFTYIYANRYGSRVLPEEDAVASAGEAEMIA